MCIDSRVVRVTARTGYSLRLSPGKEINIVNGTRTGKNCVLLRKCLPAKISHGLKIPTP